VFAAAFGAPVPASAASSPFLGLAMKASRELALFSCSIACVSLHNLKVAAQKMRREQGGDRSEHIESQFKTKSGISAPIIAIAI
jgi:hypothetical protein